MDFGSDASGTNNVFIPSSQRQSASSEFSRPLKRRRLNVGSYDVSSDGETDDYDLPSNETDEEDENLNGISKTKYDGYLYVPQQVQSQGNEFVTQTNQQWSSPSAIRGPRWRKPSCSPPVRTDAIRQSMSALSTRLPECSTHTMVDSTPFIADEIGDFDGEILSLIERAPDNDVYVEPLQPQLNPPAQSKLLKQSTLFGKNANSGVLASSIQAQARSWPWANRSEDPTHHEIDLSAMNTWTYPLNVGSLREYQYNIVNCALFHNTLVALPTGLGKTFIAASVMLNYFNWTRKAQIVFVAPTKPLVTQQVDACFHIAGIPRSQTTLLTGEIQPSIRAEEWQEKRVFFMTPQTLINDLKSGLADPKNIVLLVVDEAHKATGSYAYVEVVKFLQRFNSSFRVLALTATPGASVEAVQKVIDGLNIARVEIRTEESLDIRQFVHSRKTEVQLFDNSEEIEMCLDLFATAVRPVLQKVNSLNAYYSNDPKAMTLYGLMKGREQWAKSEAGRSADWGKKGMVNSCFKPLMTLAHNLELLKFHGVGPFYHKMRIFEDEANSNGKYSKQIAQNDSFRTLMSRLKLWINDDSFVGHPKLSYLNGVVLNHFMDAGNGVEGFQRPAPLDTKIMVFAHYRDSAEEIVRVLNKHAPIVKAHIFVGQSSTKGSEGMDQKTQMDIIKKFKNGTFNTLVATSIGEEGLDIGEVDLIVCYDCSKSPIRMLQRMGRTGRKRAGKIVLLLMRGKEERDYYLAKDNYQKMQQIIENGREFAYHFDKSPRIVPQTIQPVVDKRHVSIPFENTQGGSLEPRKRKAKNSKKPPKKFHMPDGVETGFSFLGPKFKTAATSKPRITSSETLTDLYVATLPSVKSVLLSPGDQHELDSRYAQVAGDGTVYIQPVQLDAYPEQIHKTVKTGLITHSNVTKNIARACRRMRQREWSWTRSQRCVMAHGSRSTPRYIQSSKSDLQPHDTYSSGRARAPRTPIRSGQVSICKISSHRSDCNIDPVLDSEPTTPSRPCDKIGGSQMTTEEKIFYLSQQSKDEAPEWVDLPDMAEFLRPENDFVGHNHRHDRCRAANVKSRKRQQRRIVDDDSDE